MLGNYCLLHTDLSVVWLTAIRPQHIAATQALMKAKATRKRQSKEKKTGAAKRQKVSESARTQTRSEGSPIEGTALSR